MTFLRSTIGYMLAGMFAMAVWGELATAYGVLGGWVAGFIILGSMWFLNHRLGLIKHSQDSAFVDMGLGIGLCGIFRDLFINGFGALAGSLPTLILVIIGASLGGYLAAKIEEDMEKD